MRYKTLIIMLIALLLSAVSIPVRAQFITLAVLPNPVTVNVGDSFTVVTEITSGGTTIEGAEIYLNFDASRLQVTGVSVSTFSINFLGPSFDNAAGTVSYIGGTLPPLPSGIVSVLNVTFNAIAPSTGTAIDVGSGTQVVSEGSFVLNFAQGTTVIINGPTPIPPTPIPPTPIPPTPIPPTPIPPTPIPPTPIPPTPIPPTPIPPTPIPPTPIGATPVPPTPIPPTPIPPTPIPPTPIGATPVPPTPIPPTPIPPTPIPPTPVPPTPIGATPVPPTPIGATPIPPTPVGATVVPPTSAPSGGGGSSSSNPSTSDPNAFQCPFINSGASTVVYVTVPPNAVTAPNGPANVYCRILTTNAEIGVTDSNLIRAVEIFALSVNGQNSITRFNLPVQVCLLGTGSLLFRDANAAPRAPEAIASQSEGGYTCTSIPNAGTVVLIGGDTPQPSPSAPTVPSSISVAGTHVVQPGENLFRIALRYGVPVNLLAAVNNITDPRRIFVGQSLIIPSTTAGAILLPSTPLPIATVATTTLLPEGENFLHEVMWGQTLYSIALRYGLTVSDIAVANNIVNPRLIYPGQILVIPLGEVAETHALPTIQRQHIVQYGETLWRIAQYYQVSLTAIATVNQITNINLIQVGQVLIIP